MRAVRSASIAEAPGLEVIKKIDIFLDKRTSVVHYTFSERGSASAVRDAHKAPADPAKQIRRRKARIWMDEDKPRKRDMQSPGRASARGTVRLGRARRRPLDGAVGDFFPSIRPQAIDNPRFGEKN
jgi:hypothetical protein